MLAQAQSAIPSGMVDWQRNPEQQRPPSTIPYPFHELLFGLREELPGAREAARVPVAIPLGNMQSTTQLMARHLGFWLPPDLPASCYWMGLPPLDDNPRDDISRAPLTVLFPGIMGGPALFEHLAPRIRAPDGNDAGVVAIAYSPALLQGCATWSELMVLCTERVQQLIKTATGAASAPARLIAYSFGCRIAFAVAARLEEANHSVRVILIDGPIGGQRGSLENAILGLSSVRAPHSAMHPPTSSVADSHNDVAMADKLVSLLASGGDESISEIPSRLGQSIALFIASDDEVGVEVTTNHLPLVDMQRVRGGHRDLLSSTRAGEVAELINMAGFTIHLACSSPGAYGELNHGRVGRDEMADEGGVTRGLAPAAVDVWAGDEPSHGAGPQPQDA